MTAYGTTNGASEKKRRYRAVVRRDGEKCARCGATTCLTLDHIVPKSRGGSNAIVNLQLLCEPCNQAKGNTLDGARVTKRRLRPSSRGAINVPAPPLQHLPGCDASYCVHGCPVGAARA